MARAPARSMAQRTGGRACAISGQRWRPTPPGKGMRDGGWPGARAGVARHKDQGAGGAENQAGRSNLLWRLTGAGARRIGSGEVILGDLLEGIGRASAHANVARNPEARQRRAVDQTDALCCGGPDSRANVDVVQKVPSVAPTSSGCRRGSATGAPTAMSSAYGPHGRGRSRSASCSVMPSMRSSAMLRRGRGRRAARVDDAGKRRRCRRRGSQVRPRRQPVAGDGQPVAAQRPLARSGQGARVWPGAIGRASGVARGRSSGISSRFGCRYRQAAGIANCTEGGNHARVLVGDRCLGRRSRPRPEHDLCGGQTRQGR
jgi:hypothetical protein